MADKPVCPHCLTRDLDEHPAGAMVTCRICASTFSVPEAAEELPPVSPKSKRNDDDRPAEPRSERARRRRDEEEEVERPRRRRREEDDEDERPRRRKRAAAKSGDGLMYVVFGGGIFFLLVLAGIGYLVFASSPNDKPPPPPVAQVDPPKVVVDNQMKAAPPQWNQPQLAMANPEPAPAPPQPKAFQPKIDLNPPRVEDFGGPKVAPEPPAFKPTGGLVQAAKEVIAIKPSVAADMSAINLPGAADSACVGGGGRFIIFRLPKPRQLAVFDVTHGKVVKYIPLAEDKPLFAGGMTKLFVLNPTASVIQRWNLVTFEKETTQAVPVGGTPKQMLIGHATDGPLYLGGNNVTAKHYTFLDTKTFRSYDIPLNNKNTGRGGPAISDWYPPTVRVSANGRVYTWWTSGLSPSGVNSFVIGTDGADSYNQHDSAGALLPGPDGSIFTMRGVYSPELKLGTKAPDQFNWANAAIPATSGPWYLNVTMNNDRLYGGAGTATTADPKVALKMLGDDRPLFTMNKLAGFDQPTQPGYPTGGTTTVAMHDRIHFVPEADLIVVLNSTADRLFLHKFNLKDRLEASGIDYLLALSKPSAAYKGTRFEYKPTILSKKGGVKLKLESGPDGMKVDGDKIVWPVPDKFEDREVTAIVTVSDASGQEVFHTFSLAVGEKSDARAGGGSNIITLPDPPPPAPGEAPMKVVREAPTSGGLNLIVPPPTHPSIKPTSVTGTATETLAAAADDACYAGGGRYILFTLPSVKQCAVFDSEKGKVVKSLPLPEEESCVAGGATKLFIVSPAAKVIQRYSLDTFEKEATAPLAVDSQPLKAVIGHGTDGPLLVVGKSPLANGKRSVWLSAQTFKPLTVNVTGWDDWAGEQLAVSGNGRVYGNAHANYFYWAHLTANGAAVQWTSNAYGAPLYNGDLYVQGNHIHPAKNPNLPPNYNQGRTGTFDIPAAHGPISVRLTIPQGYRPPNDKTPSEAKFAIALFGKSTTEIPVTGFDELLAPPKPAAKTPNTSRLRPRPGTEMQPPVRAHFIPDAELLVVESSDRTTLTLKKLNLADEYAKKATELVIVSRPPIGVTRGKSLSYKPVAWGAKGEVQWKLDAAPNGVGIKNGAIVWDVPPGYAADEVEITLKATADGKDATQSITLSVGD